MKKCTKCKIEKELSEFRRRGNGYTSWCKECKRALDREYKRTPEQKKRKSDLQFDRRFKTRHLIRQYKLQNPCIDCGERDPVVLDFDHRDSSLKLFDISASPDKPWEQLLSEIEKCDVRCANCHRRRTAQQRGYWIPESITHIWDPDGVIDPKLYVINGTLWLRGKE